ncbi:MAG: hypothetical protein ACLTQH_02665 [Fusobacterium sp.]
MTESIVARAQGNYVIDDIAADAKLNLEQHNRFIFPILSRNRFLYV